MRLETLMIKNIHQRVSFLMVQQCKILTAMTYLATDAKGMDEIRKLALELVNDANALLSEGMASLEKFVEEGGKRDEQRAN